MIEREIVQELRANSDTTDDLFSETIDHLNQKAAELYQ